MRKLLTTIFFLIIINNILQGSDCVKFRMSLIYDYLWLPVIFTGTVVKIDKPEIHPYYKLYKMVTFRINKIYKGEIKSKFIKIGIYDTDSPMQASCDDIINQINEKWLIFTFTRYKDYFITSSGTKSAKYGTNEFNDNLILLEDIVHRQNGYNKFYNLEGKLVAEGKFINKIPDDYWNFYTEHGQLRYKNYYRMGYLDSFQFQYVNGKIEFKNIYKNGELISDVYFDSSGLITYRKKYQNDLTIDYDANGNKIFKEDYLTNTINYY